MDSVYDYVIIPQRIATVIDRPFTKLYDKAHKFTPPLFIPIDGIVGSRHTMECKSLYFNFFSPSFNPMGKSLHFTRFVTNSLLASGIINEIYRFNFTQEGISVSASR